MGNISIHFFCHKLHEKKYLRPSSGGRPGWSDGMLELWVLARRHVELMTNFYQMQFYFSDRINRMDRILLYESKIILIIL